MEAKSDIKEKSFIGNWSVDIISVLVHLVFTLLWPELRYCYNIELLHLFHFKNRGFNNLAIECEYLRETDHSNGIFKVHSLDSTFLD